jgi:glycosyltransferase involved in cell wall biosynthesis
MSRAVESDPPGSLSADGLGPASVRERQPSGHARAPGDGTHRIRLAIIWPRFGPWHHARLRAAARLLDLTGIEMSGEDNTYAWDKVPGSEGFHRVTLFPDCDCDTRPGSEVGARLTAILDEIKPEVLVIPSWGENYAHAALAWSMTTATPNVVVSDSNYHDKRRRWWIESLKRRLVRYSQAGMVPSKEERTYLEVLGMPKERVFAGYDVVDNDHFARGSAEARRDAARVRAELRLPEHFFLASARFVPKKNLPRLLEAFAQYRQLSGPEAWDLVLLGDGALRPELQAQRDALLLGGNISMPGFKQYGELPAYYGLAQAFILPSTEEQWGLVVNEAMACGLPVLVSKRCGCARTLVRERVNGFTFDPLDTQGLARLMLKLSSGEMDLSAMGRASLEIISHWTPDTFADNLLKAAECALSQPRPRAGVFDSLLISALIGVPRGHKGW